MLKQPPIPPFIARRRAAVTITPTPTPTPTALTLTAATYAEATSVTLTFDRAVDASGLDGTQIAVADGPGGNIQYAATGGVTIVSPETITLGLVPSGEPTMGGIYLNASPATGIVAADDGGTWEGASGLGLPYP